MRKKEGFSTLMESETENAFFQKKSAPHRNTMGLNCSGPSAESSNWSGETFKKCQFLNFVA